MQPAKCSTLPSLVILVVSAMLCPFAAAQLSTPAPQTTSQPTSLMQQRQSRGFVARPTIFPEGSPTSMSPVPNLYGLSGSIALFRLDLTNSVLKGEDKISLNLKPGFIVDSVQIQYLVYSGNGSPSVSAPDLTHPPVIQGNDVLIDWPIFSVTQTGQSQPVFYSVYALSMWVDGPVGFKSPWANDSN